MSDRGSTETGTRAGGSTALWVGALVLAAAATAVLVVSDDARLLRLGLVAALWSALIGAFGVARLRHRVAQGEKAVEDRKRIYELELEREIAARREFELEAEAEARRKAAAETTGELKHLQEELQKLRSSLEQVVGGDVLFERVALRAESTRVRSLNEGGQKVQNVANAFAQPARGRELSPPAAQNTDLMSRLSGEQPEHRSKAHPRLAPRAAQAHPPRPAPVRRPEAVHHEPPQRAPEPPKATPEHPPAPDPAGAHSEGTSVNDLIAAYGAAPDTPRRRRRRA